MSRFVDTVRAFTDRRIEPEAELVLWLNGLIALAMGAFVWLLVDVSFWAAAGAAAGTFLLLLVLLTNPYSAIVAGALGSAAAGGMGAVAGTSLGYHYGGSSGAWAGGIIAGVGLLVVAASSYRKLVRAGLAAKDRSTATPP